MRQVVNDVLGEGQRREETVSANTAGDVKAKPEDGARVKTRSTRGFDSDTGSRIRERASAAIGVS